MSIIKGAEFPHWYRFRISWLAWALNTPTVLISSFLNLGVNFKLMVPEFIKNPQTSGYFNTHKIGCLQIGIGTHFKKIKINGRLV